MAWGLGIHTRTRRASGKLMPKMKTIVAAQRLRRTRRVNTGVASWIVIKFEYANVRAHEPLVYLRSSTSS